MPVAGSSQRTEEQPQQASWVVGRSDKGAILVIRRFLVVLAWSFVIPVAACTVLAAVWTQPLGWILLPLVSAALVAAVLVGVHHAEVVAHRVGEPFGTLILAMAVTVIELGLIGSIMLSGGPAASTLARNTVFATVMIVLNGVVGLCLLMGAIRHHILAFRVEGASHALSVLAPLTVLTLVLPTFTTTTIGPTYSSAQLAFAGVSSLVLYGVFVFVQTVRHRDYFLPVETEADGEHAAPPTVPVTLTSLALLLVSRRCRRPRKEACTKYRSRGASSIRASSGCRHRHCNAGPSSRNVGRSAGRSAQSNADKSKPRTRLGTRHDWPDYPGRGGTLSHTRAAAGARLACDRDSATGTNAIGSHNHFG